jgi:nucleotide-binding universal stress UspA family protein
MAAARRFHVLIATDGSANARGAVATAVRFPWPGHASASAIFARQARADYRKAILLAALDRSAQHIRRTTVRALSRRWPGADARIVNAPPIDAILAEARRVSAGIVVMGWRGHGAVRRILTGSVSRGVVRGASCPVLVVRRTLRQLRHVVLGFDGSAYARQAVALLGECDVPRGAGVTLFTAVDRMHLPPQALAPADVRRAIEAEVTRINQARVARAHADLDSATERLTAAGWQVTRILGETPPLGGLLHAVTTTRADLLAVGAKGATGLRHLLLGSVAEGALNHSPVPVLIAR